MPPNVPGGIPGIALIFARLLVEGEDRGLRIFIVNIHDGLRTFPGITVRYEAALNLALLILTSSIVAVQISTR